MNMLSLTVQKTLWIKLVQYVTFLTGFLKFNITKSLSFLIKMQSCYVSIVFLYR